MSKKDMLGQIVEKLVQVPDELLVLLYDLLQKLTGSKPNVWEISLKTLLRREMFWFMARRVWFAINDLQALYDPRTRQKTPIKPGVTIGFCAKKQYITCSIGARALYFSGNDDKMLVSSFILDEKDFRYFVEMVACVNGLSFEEVPRPIIGSAYTFAAPQPTEITLDDAKRLAEATSPGR